MFAVLSQLIGWAIESLARVEFHHRYLGPFALFVILATWLGEPAAVHERLSDLALVSGVETATQEAKVAAIQEHLSALFSLSEQDRDSHQAAITSIQELVSEFFSANKGNGEAQQAEVNGLQDRFLNENFRLGDTSVQMSRGSQTSGNGPTPGSPLSATALEKSLGVVLPDDHKTFLCLSNGLDTLDIAHEWVRTLYGIRSVTLLESPEVLDGVEAPIDHLICLCHMCHHELCRCKARCKEDGYKEFLQIMNKSPTDWPRYSRLVLVGSEGPWGQNAGYRANVYLVPPGDTKRAADIFLHTLNSQSVDEALKQEIRLRFLHNGSPCGLWDLNWLSQPQTWPVLVDDAQHSPRRTRIYPGIAGYLESMVELGSG
ncbi:hypothetical protein DL766_002920 [Monosporascus sp. MC13-8B]|nr:hypothetical protein DL763_007838 [Monosporascus cannonballus]RYP34553.1 hypothetical protein DL766_002920 [Monosporascus sp. MC13-8B]